MTELKDLNRIQSEFKDCLLLAESFLKSCHRCDQFSLTKGSDISIFSNCFGVFLSNALNRMDKFIDVEFISKRIFEDLLTLKIKRAKVCHSLSMDKEFMQALAFSLSALWILKKLDFFEIEDLILEVVEEDTVTYLDDIASSFGKPQSGNLAMCMAVMYIFLNEHSSLNFNEQIELWVDYHIDNMNDHGFWGDGNFTHLQFQNGYHQYEIFEYLHVENKKLDNATYAVSSLADSRGQFAPYFGGSGCYEYDAITILTSKKSLMLKNIDLINRTIGTIFKDQNQDGGFSESKWIRPRTIKSFRENITKIIHSPNLDIFMERLRYFSALNHPKHNKIKTHWTSYSRDWSESNTWDTWFRLMTIARVLFKLDKHEGVNWSFINFPGIGFYNSN